MRQEHIDRYIETGKRVRATLDAYDRKLIEDGFTITTTTTQDSRGTHVRTDYVSPTTKRKAIQAARIVSLEAQIKAGPPDGVRAGNEYMGQLKCQLLELVRERDNA